MEPYNIYAFVSGRLSQQNAIKVHGAECIRISFLLMAIFVHLLVILDTIYNATKNTCVQVSESIFSSLGYIPRSGTAESYGFPRWLSDK